MVSAPGSEKQVRDFYDAAVRGKLGDFIHGNERIERAWQMIKQWAPAEPKRILEVGCGIGAICWRMARTWPEAEVVGVDISPKSIEVASKLFAAPRLSFSQAPLAGDVLGVFDLIVLMDVYEHISLEDRPRLHEALLARLAPEGRMAFSFPTPRHLAFLREQHPACIQPVDENIDVKAVSDLALATQTSVMLYQEVDVWHKGDYAHAVLGRPTGWRRVEFRPPASPGLWEALRGVLQKNEKDHDPTFDERMALVRRRLGNEWDLNDLQ